MSILTIIQDVCIKVKAVPPASGVCSPVAPDEIREMISVAHTLGQLDLRREKFWNSLMVEGTITLVEGQSEYSLPSDFDGYIVPGTEFNRTDYNQVLKLMPHDWHYLRYSRGQTLQLSQLYRFRKATGGNDLRIVIEPVPTAQDAGTVLGFEYLSKNWVIAADGTRKFSLTEDTDSVVWSAAMFALGIASGWMELNKIDPYPFKGQFETSKASEYIAQNGMTNISWGYSSRGDKLNYPGNV